jgi:ABC-type iron transport system FetAB ATPase subunit
MMTGQILGGSPVTEAAHYQILIMYLIATCLFCALFTNVFILYWVAFDGAQVLRVDRFIEIIDEKQNKNHNVSIAENFIMGLQNCCCGLLGRQQHILGAAVGNDLETQQLNYGSGNSVPTNRITILTRQFSSNGSVPFFRIESLSFSVPKDHSKKRRNINADARSSSLPPSDPQTHQRVLCTDLNASLNKGEIGIVKGPSGSGKSTLLRVLSGLTPMDIGDVIFSGMSLRGCSSYQDGFGHCMIQWRTNVRYVTQYKVDLPGTPRDFVSRIASFHSHSRFDSPTENEMISQTASYLQGWGMGENECGDDHCQFRPLDREWKTLSGGESQRMLLAIAMASRGRILLLDEATSGLDDNTQKRVEGSVVDYVKTNGAAVLWVTHSEDIAERLLAQ